MRDKLYIVTRLEDCLCYVNSPNPQTKANYTARTEAYMWLYNNGNLRKEVEINFQIQNCLDELIMYERMGVKTPMKIKPLQEKVKIFRDALLDGQG